MHSASLDVSTSGLKVFVCALVANEILFEIASYGGPAGGNAEVDIKFDPGSIQSIKAFLLKHYDQSMTDEDFELYCGFEN